MRALSVLLCVLMTMSSFSVLTAFATENKTNNTQATVTDNTNQHDNLGCKPLTEEEISKLSKIENISDYYSIVNKEEGKPRTQANNIPATSYPSSIDNSKSKYFPFIGNQHSLGSCTTWAEIYYQMSYAENVALNRTATHDNTCSPVWIYNFANGGDANTGADITHAFRLAQRIGVPSLKTSPNTTVNAKWTTTKEAFTEAPKYRVNNYNLFYLDTYNNKITNPKSEVIAPIKAALNNNELVTYTTYVFSWKNKTIQKDSRVPENTKYANDDIAIYSTGYSGCHRMTIVGYDDDIWVDINGDGKIQEAEKGAFKIVNSWGTGYGNNGFAWVSYDALNYDSAVSDSLPNRLNQPTIFDLMRVSVKPIDACSNINLEYTLNTKYRDEVSIAITAKNKNTGKTYEGNVEPFQSYKKEYVNCRCSFDGTKNYSTGDFAYDLSNIVQNLNSNNVSDYTWTLKFDDDTSDDSTLSVSDVKIVDNNNNKTYKSDLNGTVKLNGNSKDITVNAGGTTPDKNAVTIYYKGYSSPYIHYQVGDGNWTTAPGKAMTPDTTVDGYTHTYTIDLGTSDYANVCFNDGNNNWDSKNGQNYKFKKGTYTFKNGVITPIEVDNKFGIKSFDITPADGKIEAGDYASMKVTLKNATSNAVSKFTYLDSNNREVTIYDYAGASGCSWQFNKSGTYRVRVYSKESYGSTNYVMAEKTVTVLPKDNLMFTQTYPNTETTVDAGYSFYVSADVTGGTAPYKYEFGYTKDGKVTSYTTDKNFFVFYPKEEATLIPFVKVTDATGKTISHTYKPIKVINGLKITDIKVTPSSPQVVGTKLNIKADIINGHEKYGRLNICEYRIMKNGKVVETLDDPYQKSADWIPTEAGNYTITCYVNDISGQSATKTVNFVVKEKNTTENKVTIYYKGYSTAYIHYQVENGSWTNAPGYKMTATDEKDGYSHKYVINLGDKNYANVCFNDGNGNWDSNNGRNYRFNKGTYTFKNGVITQVEDDKFGIESFDITPADGKITVGDFIDMKVKLKNATSDAVSKFTYLDSNDHEVTIYNYTGASGCSWQFNKSGTYRVRVYSKEGYGSTNYVMAEKTVTVAEKQPLKINQFNINSNAGSVPFYDNVNMSVNASGGKAPYQYEFAMNQYNTRTVLQPFSTKNTFTVIPEYVGNYNYEVTVKDATGATVTVTKSIYVAQACIENLNISSSTVKVNDIVKFSADIKNLSSLVTYHDYTYTVTKDNKTETLTTNSDRTANWTPKEAGKYTMLLQIKHNGKYIAGRSIEVTVDKASENVITIYYKGYSTPYIHYQVGNGSWTDAPGYKMTSTNEKSGYTHKYTINLGTSTYANVCFNNGNGSWDSRNGQNYHFEKGTYTFSNGNMTKIAD